MKYVVEKENKLGFTLIKKDCDGIICGRFTYRIGGEISIANASMCKKGTMSKDVTSRKLKNFFDSYDVSVDIGFKNSFFEDLINFVNMKKRQGWNYNRTILPEYFICPCYEILIKAGYGKSLVKNSVCIKKSGKNPSEILNMTKTQLKIYKEYGDIFPIKDNDFAILYYNTIKKMIAEDLQADFYTYGVAERIYKLYKKYNYKIDKLVDYAGNACRFTQGITSIREIITLLLDLNNMHDDMDVKLNEKYPKSLKKEHDLAVMRHKICISEMQENKYNIIKKEKSFLEYTTKYATKDYVFILPKNLEDIKQEGKVLCHCVGSYCDRVSKGSTNIIFMREKDNLNNRLVTVEVSNNNTIFQARGEHNRGLRVVELNALEEYKKYLRGIKTNEEVVL